MSGSGRKGLFASLMVVCALLAGCATSLNTYSDKPVGAGKAVVLIIVDSDIPLAEARYCTLMCVAWYKLGGRRDVMAYPVRVGSTFKINTLMTGDGRAAGFNGHELNIDKPGVYYYATIRGTQAGASIGPMPSDDSLRQARMKYFDMLKDLPPANFAWPAEAAALESNYVVSTQVQQALRAYQGKTVRLGVITPPQGFRAGCRSVEIGLPDHLPYETYMRLALEKEFRAAGLLAEAGDAPVVEGRLVDMETSTVPGYWRIAAELTAGVRVARADEKHVFRAGQNGNEACARLEQEFPSALQAVILRLVESDDFAAMLE